MSLSRPWADRYIGNDTGMLNVAAAVGTPAIGLFGATLPLAHSEKFSVVTPEDGIRRDGGMEAITVEAVVEAIQRLGWP